MRGELLHSLAGAAGPEVHTEAKFEAGDGHEVGPGVSGQDAADDGHVDVGASGGFSQTDVIGYGSEVGGELSGDFGDRVGADLIGPVDAELSRAGASGATHDTRVSQKGHLVLVSSNTSPKMSPTEPSWKDHEENINRVIEKYQPANMPRVHWTAIEEVARDFVRRSGPTTYFQAHNHYAAVAYFVEWAWMLGMDLDEETLFTRSTIERYIEEGCPNLIERSKGTRRSVLFTVAGKLLGPNHAARRAKPIKWDSPKAPYTEAEMQEFVFWANSQHTAINRQAAQTALALAAGAGFAPEDIIRVAVSDIKKVRGLWLVQVDGRRARTVAIRDEWVPLLRKGTKGLTKDQLAFLPGRTCSARDKVSNFITQSSGDNKPELQRLRITWLLRHVVEGVPLQVLIRAFGVKELHSISRYLTHLPELSDTDYLSALARLR